MTALCQAPTAIAPSGHTLRNDRRGGMTLFVALAFPATIAMGLLAIDAVRAYSQASQINFATQAAALAAGSQLGNYYSQGATNGTTAISAAASTIANANIANLSNVTSSTTVTLGNWDSVSSTFTGLAVGSTSPNAVQVVGSATINTILASSFVGQPSLTVSKTAVATLGSPKTFNVIVLNEMGGPNLNQGLGVPGSAQANWWTQQQAADLAILNCVAAAGNTASQFGITGYVEQAYTLQALTPLSSASVKTTIANNINNVGSSKFQYCRQSKSAQACHGSNVAAGIYSAISQFSGAAYASTSNHIVVLTNELPIYDPTANPAQNIVATNYSLAMGTGVSQVNGVWTGGAATGICNGAAGTTTCTNTLLQEMAEGQAVTAGTAVPSGRSGITISTIYYSTDNNTVSPTAVATEIASWTKNGGLSMRPYSYTDTASAGGFVTQAAKVCQMIGATLRLASP